MKNIHSVFLWIIASSLIFGQSNDPQLSSWLLNTTGLTGYNGLPANVQKVQYSQDYVYISSSGIPAYSIGPWPGDPNKAAEQDFVFKIPRHPSEETSAKLSTPLGPIGVLINGVVIFNSKDANSYNNQGVWHRNAVIVEATSFDSCLGHPQMNGIYHHHQNPVCLYKDDSTKHSPLIGYAFDGYPIYGKYGYVNPDGTGGIKRMVSSYQLRNITKRTTLPDGTKLSSNEYGPDVSTQYPLGYFIEDYEYVDSSGDLDQYNGRYTVTPDYPDGIYAYFVTTNSDGSSAYPYIIGPQYYGTVARENIQTKGHVSINESVTNYDPSTGVKQTFANINDYKLSQNYPNPFNPSTVITYSVPSRSFVDLSIFNSTGEKISTLVRGIRPRGRYEVNFTPGENSKQLSSGVYFYRLKGSNFSITKKLIYLR